MGRGDSLSLWERVRVRAAAQVCYAILIKFAELSGHAWQLEANRGALLIQLSIERQCRADQR
jgi:hypothetical protein